MKNTQKIFIFTLAILCLTACKKDPPAEPEDPGITMPPATHTGANTFGCYIDGELYVGGGADSYWDYPPVSGSFNEGTRLLTLTGVRYLNNEINESDDIIILSYISGLTGTYDFYYNVEGETRGYRNWLGQRCDYYYRDIPDLGKLTITYLNEEKHIISGTFYMNLINEDCENGDTLMKITDGRFDFRY
jgi:hypothetical protein